jgi:hypothetical protein
MTGRHESDDPVDVVEDPMPDPDNLRVDVTTLPLTGPITLPRRD